MPFPFKQVFTTKNVTPGTNTDQFIIVHHTGTQDGTIKGVLSTLTTGRVSCHFVVDTNGDAYKIGDPKQILWHAGVSEWNGLKNMNSYSMGIEIIGPTVGQFTDAQRKTVRALIQHLMAAFNIPGKNVLRHADLTNAGSAKGILWDGKSKSRKTDVADTFWKINRTTWKEYQDSLVPKLAG